MISYMTGVQDVWQKQYKWWVIYSHSIKSRTSSFYDSLYFVLGQIIILSGTILVWWLAGGKTTDTNFQNKLTYFLVGEMLFCLVFQFCSFYGFDILRGNHTTYLLRPVSFFKMVFFRYLGEAFLQSLSKLIFLGLLVIIFHKLIAFYGLPNLLLSLLFLPISLIILFLLELSVSFSAFFLKTINGVILNFGYISALLAGHTFPLNLLVPNFYLNLLNPFAFSFYHPVRLYSGSYSAAETVGVFAAGLLWCVVLYWVSKTIFRMGLKRNESIGL